MSDPSVSEVERLLREILAELRVRAPVQPIYVPYYVQPHVPQQSPWIAHRSNDGATAKGGE